MRQAGHHRRCGATIVAVHDELLDLCRRLRVDPRELDVGPDDDERVTVTLPKDEYSWFHAFADEHELTLEDVTRLALLAFRSACGRTTERTLCAEGPWDMNVAETIAGIRVPDAIDDRLAANDVASRLILVLVIAAKRAGTHVRLSDDDIAALTNVDALPLVTRLEAEELIARGPATQEQRAYYPTPKLLAMVEGDTRNLAFFDTAMTTLEDDEDD